LKFKKLFVDGRKERWTFEIGFIRSTRQRVNLKTVDLKIDKKSL